MRAGNENLRGRLQAHILFLKVFLLHFISYVAKKVVRSLILNKGWFICFLVSLPPLRFAGSWFGLSTEQSLKVQASKVIVSKISTLKKGKLLFCFCIIIAESGGLFKLHFYDAFCYWFLNHSPLTKGSLQRRKHCLHDSNSFFPATKSH